MDYDSRLLLQLLQLFGIDWMIILNNFAWNVGLEKRRFRSLTHQRLIVTEPLRKSEVCECSSLRKKVRKKERERERECEWAASSDTLTMTSVVHILKKNQPKKSFSSTGECWSRRGPCVHSSRGPTDVMPDYRQQTCGGFQQWDEATLSAISFSHNRKTLLLWLFALCIRYLPMYVTLCQWVNVSLFR